MDTDRVLPVSTTRVGDSRRHAAPLRSRQGHRLSARLHWRERGHQDQGACQPAYDLGRSRATATLSRPYTANVFWAAVLLLVGTDGRVPARSAAWLLRYLDPVPPPDVAVVEADGAVGRIPVLELRVDGGDELVRRSMAGGTSRLLCD